MAKAAPYLVGRLAGKQFLKAKWMWQSVTGNENEAIQAEQAVGRDMAKVIEEQSQGSGSPEFQILLDNIAKPLAERVKNRNHRFEIKVLLSDNPTAFALPGGFIFIAPGLVELAEKNSDELAFVIGHEMAHVIRRHAIDRILSQKALSMASLATPAGRAVAPWLRSVGMQWLEKAYSREQEYEADVLGSRLAQVAGFDPRGALRMLERFRSLEGSSDPLGLSAYVSTHPPINDRQQHIREQLRLDG
jgi:predicted Zn-dependent protease